MLPSSPRFQLRMPSPSDELDLLGLALDAPVELVELLEDLHRRARGPLRRRPVLVLRLPALVRLDASGLGVEAQGLRAVRFRLGDGDLFVRIFPVTFQPIDDRQRRLRRLGERGPPHLEDEVGLFVGPVAVRQPPLDGRMIGEMPERQGPGLLGQIPLGRIAVLVERLQVAEDAPDPLAAKPIRLLLRHIPSRLETWVFEAISRRDSLPSKAAASPAIDRPRPQG